MESFSAIVNAQKLLNIVAKGSVLDVCGSLGSGSASSIFFKNFETVEKEP